MEASVRLLQLPYLLTKLQSAHLSSFTNFKLAAHQFEFNIFESHWVNSDSGLQLRRYGRVQNGLLDREILKLSYDVGVDTKRTSYDGHDVRCEREGRGHASDWFATVLQEPRTHARSFSLVMGLVAKVRTKVAANSRPRKRYRKSWMKKALPNTPDSRLTFRNSDDNQSNRGNEISYKL